MMNDCNPHHYILFMFAMYVCLQHYAVQNYKIVSLHKINVYTHTARFARINISIIRYILMELDRCEIVIINFFFLLIQRHFRVTVYT